MSFKLILTDSFNFFKFNFKQLATLCLPLLLVASALIHTLTGGDDTTITSGADFLLSCGISMAFYPIYTTVLILLMSSQAEGRRPNNAYLISTAFSFYVPMLLLFFIFAVIAGIPIVTLVSMINYPTMTMLSPAIIILVLWILVRFSFAKFILVLKKTGPKEAILQSVQTTRKYSLVIFSSYMLLALPIFIAGNAAGLILLKHNAGNIAIITADALITFFSLFVDIVLFRIYMQATEDTPTTPNK